MNDGDYLDGEKHGDWVTYYANGNKRSEGGYKRGKKDSLWIQYWPNGIKKSEGRFAEDKFAGPYTAYHENGNRAYQGRYNEGTGTSADGTKEGVWCYYGEDGESIWRKITYRRGSRTKPDEILGDRPNISEKTE